VSKSSRPYAFYSSVNCFTPLIDPAPVLLPEWVGKKPMNPNAQERHLPESGDAQWRPPADPGDRHVGEGWFKDLFVAIGSCVALISFLSLGFFLNQVFGPHEHPRLAANFSGGKDIGISSNEERYQHLLDQQPPVYPNQSEIEAAKLRPVINPGVATCSTVGMTTFC